MARLHHVPLPPRPSANAAADLPADSDDEVLSPRGTHHPPPASFDGDDALLSLSRLSRLYSFVSAPLVRPQPALQAGRRGRCPLGYVLYRFASSFSSMALHIPFSKTRIDLHAPMANALLGTAMPMLSSDPSEAA
jgi:hypothetical protein